MRSTRHGGSLDKILRHAREMHTVSGLSPREGPAVHTRTVARPVGMTRTPHRRRDARGPAGPAHASLLTRSLCCPQGRCLCLITLPPS
jgi:hypothetical protein